MTTSQDCSVGFGTESTFGTPVVPTRWPIFDSETLDIDKAVKQGKGLRVASRGNRSARRVVPTRSAAGNVSMAIVGVGMGMLWNWALGNSTSNLVTGAVHQQVHTFGDSPPSLTIQKGIPRADGDAVDAWNFPGAMCNELEIDCSNGEIATAAFSVAARNAVAAGSYTAPSYPAPEPAPLHFGGGAIILGGTLTPPTATALATSSAAPAADVRAFKTKLGNNLDTGRYNFGAAGLRSKPRPGSRMVEGEIEVEYTGTALPAAVLADTSLGLIFTLTGDDPNHVVQIVYPDVRFNGKLPSSNGGETITTSLDFEAFDLVTQFAYIVVRTTDTAL